MKHHGRERDEQDRGRHQIGEKDRTADPLGAAVAQAHDRIGGEHAGDDRENGSGDRDQHRVAEPERIIGLEYELVDVLEGWRPGPERIEPVEIEQLLVRFDGGQRHPVEREQKHEHDQRQRQIKRDQPFGQRLQVAHPLGKIVRRRHGRAVQHLPRVGDLRGQDVSHWSNLRAPA